MHDSLNHYFTNSDDSDFAPREITIGLGDENYSVYTASAVFSPDHLDTGTKVLLKSLPLPPEGHILDIGCGWGPISLATALQSAQTRSVQTSVWAVDVNSRALCLTEMNAQRLGLSNIRTATPEQVPEDITFAEIRSNPPIRVGKEALHEILRTWLPRLEEGGAAYLVVAKKLGAESLKRWIADTWPSYSVNLHAREKGFHVLRVVR